MTATDMSLTPGEAAQRARLRRMKQAPLLLLVAMAVLFALTLRSGAAWAGWVNAFAEAAMVGALADWFAVVALFRHPLGIPVPHTAIIPRRKDEIGENLARFVADHFLQPDVVRSRMKSADPAGRMAAWLQQAAGRQRVVDLVSRLLAWGASTWREDSVRGFLRRLSRHQLERLDPGPVMARTLDWLVQDGRHQQMLTQALRYSVVLLHDNRDAIRGNVQRESPWWLPGFIDDRIVQQMLDRVETLLMQMSLDPDHPVRQDFNGTIERWIDELRHSPSMRRGAEDLRRSLLENEGLQDYLYALWTDVAAGIESELGREDSALREHLADLVDDVAREFARDDALRATVNRWLTDFTVRLVEDNRHAIASIISDTVRRWDGRETAQRVELAIGADLQYIRINGTLVGGLAGLLIHAAGVWIH